jgi:peroxiredoxin
MQKIKRRKNRLLPVSPFLRHRLGCYTGIMKKGILPTFAIIFLIAAGAFLLGGGSVPEPVPVSGSPDTSQPMVAGTPDDGSGATPYPYDIQETGDGNAIERFSAPDFSLPRLGGGEIRLSDYRGKKPVILTFFATWCPNCRRDMPAMSVVYGDISDRIEFIGIDLEERSDIVEKFIRENGIGFPIALDQDGSVGEAYGVGYTNTHVFIGRSGDVMDILLGNLDRERVVVFLERGDIW